MSRQSIVWGTCWLYEEKKTLCSFMKRAVGALSRMGFLVYSIVFDAMYERGKEEIEEVEKNTGCIVIQNKIPIFPNKNYGVAVISKIAHELGTDYTAVMDSDWKVEEFDIFMKELMSPIFICNQDLVLPDISLAAGRCNVLIGKPILSMFYPEYMDIIPTAFPGAFVGRTKEVYEITSNDRYHFDWGGEWDIVAASCERGMRIASPCLGMQNVRHRSNHSKVYDSFQIWRACLENLTEERFSIAEKSQELFAPKDSFMKDVLSTSASATKQIESLVSISQSIKLSKTQWQLAYMVLLPLAGIIDNEYMYEYLVNDETDIKQPYEREELRQISMIVPYCVWTAIRYSGKSIAEISVNAKRCYGERWSRWDSQTKQRAMKSAKDQMQRIIL